jgi:hypothetical protein
MAHDPTLETSPRRPLSPAERQRRLRWRRKNAVTIARADLLPEHIDRLIGRRLITPEDADDPEKLGRALVKFVESPVTPLRSALLKGGRVQS